MGILGLGKLIFGAGKFIGGLFTGGTLDTILRTIDKNTTDGPTAEQLKADVTKKWIDAQAALLVGRTWWFQLFFVVPLGVWWTAIILDSILPGEWGIAKLPAPLDEWAGWIMSALFIADAGKSILGRMGK
jgi:hypothetical protein